MDYYVGSTAYMIRNKVPQSVQAGRTVLFFKKVMKTMKKYRNAVILNYLWAWLFSMTIVFWGCAEKRHI
ncbi:MAG: hypothetical protein WB792_04135, partial [Desulfobacterales bacterium]